MGQAGLSSGPRASDGRGNKIPRRHAIKEEGNVVYVKYEYKKDGEDWQDIETTFYPYPAEFDTEALELSSGDYEIKAIAIDDSDNEDPSPDTLNIEIDHTSPIATITSPADGNHVERNIGIVASCTDPDVESVALQYRKKGEILWVNIGSVDISWPWFREWKTTNLKGGEYELRAVAVDDIGNIDEDPVIVTVSVQSPASCPFYEDFESGWLGGYWSTNSTNDGRIVVSSDHGPNGGSRHLLIDDSVSAGDSSLNELVLTIDLAHHTGVMLRFYHKEFDDEYDLMPDYFVNSCNADGVAISEDGVNWHKVDDLASGSSSYTLHEISLDALCDLSGISYNSHFKIKFQQYDDDSITSDGFAFDDISVEANDPGMDTDEDGMPDWWEKLYEIPTDPQFPGTDLYNPDANLDNDGDGRSNIDELEAGTDPTDANSVFAIIDIQRNHDLSEATITWNSVEGKYYSVYYSDYELGNFMTWRLAQENMPASGTGSNTWIDDGSYTNCAPSQTPNRYYRVKVGSDLGVSIKSMEKNEDCSEVTVTWSSVEGRYYAIYYSDDEPASSMTWNLAQYNMPGSGSGTNTWMDDGSLTIIPPSDVPYRWYQVRMHED